MRNRALIAACALLLALPLLLAACGGDDDAAERDPQQTLEAIFQSDESVTSGVLTIVAEGHGEGDEGGDFSIEVSGPFQSDADDDGSPPQLDLTVSASGTGGGEDLDIDGGLTVTEDNAFVEFDETTYEVGPDVFQQFSGLFAQAATERGDEDDQNVFEQLGISPERWFSELSNEGTTAIEGTETVHISGAADVEAMLSDLVQLAGQAPIGGPIPEGEVRQIANSITRADVDVYGGVDDDILRRLEVSLTIAPTGEIEDVGLDEVEIDFSLTLSDVNEDQDIEAPDEAEPFAALVERLGGFGLLGALGGLEALGEGLPGGLGEGAPGAAEQQQLEECIAQAQTPEQVNECLEGVAAP